MVEVRFHPEASDEYRGALAWYQARSPQAAMRFEAEVERILAAVAAGPVTFSNYDDDHRFAMLRRFPFSIVFQNTPDLVQVVAFAHSRRAPGYWRDRA